MICISLTGYVAEAASQSSLVASNLWKVFLLVPSIGYVVGIIVLLLFYKLRDGDVQIMAKYNNSEITYEEADALLNKKFGSPFKK